MLTLNITLEIKIKTKILSLPLLLFDKNLKIHDLLVNIRKDTCKHIRSVASFRFNQRTSLAYTRLSDREERKRERGRGNERGKEREGERERERERANRGKTTLLIRKHN